MAEGSRPDHGAQGMSTSREALDLEGSLPVWEVTRWGVGGAGGDTARQGGKGRIPSISEGRRHLNRS